MSEQPTGGMEADSNDRLLAALAYAFTPLVPIIILLLEDKKDRPFIRAHNMQALIWGIIFYVLVTVLSVVVVGFCLFVVGFFIQLYWAYKAYQGEMVTIPVISNFVQNQGWA
jgi:uncharacterized membrane protein